MEIFKSFILLLFVAYASAKIVTPGTGGGPPPGVSQINPCVIDYAVFNFDAEPDTFGLSAGEYEPGKNAYIGIGSWNHMTLNAGRVQTSPPGILLPTNGDSSTLSTSGEAWYIKKKMNHVYNWVASQNAESVQYAVDFGSKTSGTPFYIARVNNNGSVSIGIIALYMGGVYYVNNNGKLKFAQSGYEVLTCFTSTTETSLPLPQIQVVSGPNVDVGCINNWVPYNNDKEPETKGVSAGEYDCGNNAYVGKANTSDGGPFRPGRIQTTGQAGLYLLHKAKETYIQSGSYYLADNPSYTYKWVNYEGSIPSNAVNVRSGIGALYFPVTRVQISGKVKVGYQLGDQADFPTDTGNAFLDYYEVLTCDPIPRYKCAAPQFKKYNLDDAPSNDGFSAGKLNGVTAYIGRGSRKCINGCGYNIGRIQTSPSSAAGVYYTDDLSSTEIFDNVTAEYLVRNVNNTYIWKPSSDGVKVKNAIEFSQTGSHPYYIGIAVIDHNVFIGKVRPGKGLFFIDIDGVKRVADTYAVLTCFSSDSSNGL
ncbi:hypothetical protein PVAND_012667 [Polypedilum vanderplanki]|uniref:Uncharacterized protein n=1 Tax=Polypedilum vanderplanki TaxID=319348 RepID=A0A9J6CP46_POLVA|nr:hypothetical protein PVAND_012667 [Polypedilum vanderplanki]